MFLLLSQTARMRAVAVLLLCSSVMAPSLAQTVPSPTVAAKSWVLLDATSNQVIASQEADMRVEPASLAKIMTAYVVAQALHDGRLTLDQQVMVSVNAWKIDPSSSKMFIEPNKPVSIKDLLHGLMIVSGNDAAIALAEAVSGTTDAFVAQMNAQAQRMGMTGTHYGNPDGLPSADTYTTSRDMSILARNVVRDFPEFYKIDSIKSFTYNKITQPNRNRLLWLDPSVDGMKTGHTSSAGYSLIASAARPNGTDGNRRLIAVVMGTNSDSQRTQEAQKLLNWGYQNFDTVKLYSANQVIAQPTVWKGAQSTVKVGFTQDVYATTPKGTVRKMKPVLDRTDPLIAPLAEHAKIGTLHLNVDDKPLLSLPVVTLETVGRASFFGRIWDSIRLMWNEKKK